MSARATRPPRPPADRTRERATAVNQLLTGLVALVSCSVALAFGAVDDIYQLVGGLGLMFVVTGVAVIVPWNRLPPLTIAIVPLLDVVAITMMERSAPTVGLALLWVFPCLWLSSSFGVKGLVTSIVTVSAALWSTVAIAAPGEFETSFVVIPVTMAIVSAIAFLYARRATAQRMLLSRQSLSLRRAADRAHRQEAFLTEVLDAVDFGVVRLDPSGATTLANEAHARLLAPPQDDDGDRAAYAADGVTRLAPDEEPVARAERGETFESTLVWYGAPGRARRALSVTARRLRGAEGEPAGGLVVSRDVTSEVMALRAREDLIASVSHELRTPLTSILGYVELAMDAEGLPSSTRSNLQVVERNAERLLHIVSDLLAAAADARGGIALTFHPERTDVSRLVGAAVDAIAAQADARSITIDTTGVEDATAWTDPLRLRQVVDNLLSNAVKYHHEGGRIEVGVTSDVDHAWVVVRDDGPGIRAEEVPLLFDRFYRADAVRHTSAHGSGLGLAISLEMMRAQGGDITVRTEEGKGSTFIVRIPLRSGEED
ncbi:sensor histidine kinase [Microbacterium sp. MC2]